MKTTAAVPVSIDAYITECPPEVQRIVRFRVAEVQEKQKAKVAKRKKAKGEKANKNSAKNRVAKNRG